MNALTGTPNEPLPETLPIQRPRLLRDLAKSVSPVRLVVAPPGFGKSTLCKQLGCPSAAIEEHAGEIEVCRSIAEAAGLRASALNTSDLAAALVQERISEIAIDDVHFASEDGRRAVNALIAAVLGNVRVTLFTRSSDVILQRNWLFDGIIHTLDAKALAFDVDETLQIAKCFGIHAPAEHVQQMLGETSGWPVVVSGAIAAASRRRESLDRAFETWCAQFAVPFSEWVEAQARRSPHGDAFLDCLARKRYPAPGEALVWEREGLFMTREGASVEILAPLRPFFSSARGPQRSTAEPIVVKLFGDLQASIGGVPVKWVRRKDAQVFKYLLLKPSGAATRQELMRVFWPERDQRTAAQSLRTTCSNIRHALREVVSEANVRWYFQSADEIAVTHEHTLTDIAEFRNHVNRYRAALDRGSSRYALLHLQRARELYRGDLLVDMPSCGFDDLAIELRNNFGEVLHRLRTLSLERGPLAVDGTGPGIASA